MWGSRRLDGAIAHYWAELRTLASFSCDALLIADGPEADVIVLVIRFPKGSTVAIDASAFNDTQQAIAELQIRHEMNC